MGELVRDEVRMRDDTHQGTVAVDNRQASDDRGAKDEVSLFEGRIDREDSRPGWS